MREDDKSKSKRVLKTIVTASEAAVRDTTAAKQEIVKEFLKRKRTLRKETLTPNRKLFKDISPEDAKRYKDSVGIRKSVFNDIKAGQRRERDAKMAEASKSVGQKVKSIQNEENAKKKRRQ